MTRKSYLFLLILVALVANQTLAADFYAYYTHLKTSEAFEKYSHTGDYADIVAIVGVKKFIFWLGTNYLPYLETKNGKWNVQELIPRKGDGTAEMPDAVNRFSHVAIIESTKDKIVILSRYLPQFQMNRYPYYPINVSQTQFVEEIFTITPDGMVYSTIQTGCEKIYEWNSPEHLIKQTFRLSENKDFRQSVVRDTEGKQKLVIWLNYQSNSSTKIKIENGNTNFLRIK